MVTRSGASPGAAGALAGTERPPTQGVGAAVAGAAPTTRPVTVAAATRAGNSEVGRRTRRCYPAARRPPDLPGAPARRLPGRSCSRVVRRVEPAATPASDGWNLAGAQRSMAAE